MTERTQPAPEVWKFVRTGTNADDAATITQRAATFTAGAPEGTVLLTRRDEDGLHHYVIFPGGSGDQSSIVSPLSRAVAARAEEVADPGVLMDAKHIVAAAPDLRSPISRSTQAGADITEMSRLIAPALGVGEWVAAVIRSPSKHERNWHKRWIEHHVGSGTKTHHTFEQGAVVMSLWAGSETSKQAKQIIRQTTTAMPGFDIHVSPKLVTVVARGLLTILVGFACLIGGTWLASLPWVQSAHSLYTGVGFIAGAGLPTVLAGIMYLAGRIPSFAEKAKRFARNNTLVRPKHRWLPPAKPQQASTDKDGNKHAAKSGAYPLAPTAFMVGPALPAGLIAPHAGADSGSVSTATRIAPAVLRQQIGPFVGWNDDAPVHLSAADLYSGVMAFGLAGSGKSRLLQALFAWTTLERLHPSGKDGHPGRNNTVIVFENKGEGAAESGGWADGLGDQCAQIDLAGPSTPGAPSSENTQIDILSIPGDAITRARFLVNALKYAFSDGSIQERSFDTLVQVFTAALTVTPELATLGEAEPGKSPFYYASILLGARGDDAGVKLAGAIRSEAVRIHATEDTDLGQAAVQLAQLYEGKTTSQRAGFTDAPRNKVSALLAAESWWARPNRITWDRILGEHHSIILNAGASTSGHQMDDELSRQMQSLLMYTLEEAIKRNCAGWEKQGRAVTIVADELKLLSGSSASVITWLREQGRSYGVRLIFATQNPHQLETDVLNSVMGFGTMFAFAQNNARVVNEIVQSLNLAGRDWDTTDIVNLPRFEAVVRTTAAGVSQTPFTLRIHDFWGDRFNFARLQGYPE